MWRLPKLDDTLVTITFQPHLLSCSIITTSNHTAPFALHAYTETPLQQLELEQLKIFNPTLLQNYIINFLDIHQVRNAFITCMLNGPGIYERFIPMHTANPQLDDFLLPEKQMYTWEYRYVYPIDHGRWMFYVSGIKKDLLFQYKLLAIAGNLNITTITTQRSALLSLYKFQQGKAFRTSKLAIDMLHHHNMPEQLFCADTLGRLLYIPPRLIHQRVQATAHLLNACGLYVAERIFHETY